jgi:hypothetical protein
MLERPASHPGTEQSTRSDRDRPRVVRGRRGASGLAGTLPVAAVTAALWAAAVGLVVVGGLVTLVWALSARGDDGISTPVSATGVVWLAAHHAPVDAAGSTITLLPMLLLGVVLLLLARAGRWAARITRTSTTPDAVLLVVAGTATYAGIAVLLAEVSSLGGATVPALQSFGWATLVAAVGLTLGVLDAAELLGPQLDRLPSQVRAAGPVARAIGAVLAGCALLLVVVALALHWSTVASMSHQLAPGAGDATGLVLAQLAFLPNLVVWALAYLVGPGFAVGGGASVDPFSATGALLPGVPVLGAVPLDAPAAAPFLLLLPVVAGMVGAVVMRRRGTWSLRDEVVVVLTGAALVGAATVLLCALSGGSFGGGRLSELGPPALLTGLAATGLTAAGALLWTLAAHVRPLVWAHDDV